MDSKQTLIALVFASNTGPLFNVDGTFLEFLSPFGPNLAFFAVIFYLIYYAILDPIAAVKTINFLLFFLINMLFIRLSLLQSFSHSVIQQLNSYKQTPMLTKSLFTFMSLLGFSNSLDMVSLKREVPNYWII